MFSYRLRRSAAPCYEQDVRKKPAERNPAGFLFWRRPTLAQPIAVLPSGLQRFTAVFGMGTGGTTALVSPECGTAQAARCCRSEASAITYSGDYIANFQRTSIANLQFEIWNLQLLIP